MAARHIDDKMCIPSLAHGRTSWSRAMHASNQIYFSCLECDQIAFASIGQVAPQKLYPWSAIAFVSLIYTEIFDDLLRVFPEVVLGNM